MVLCSRLQLAAPTGRSPFAALPFPFLQWGGGVPERLPRSKTGAVVATVRDHCGNSLSALSWIRRRDARSWIVHRYGAGGGHRLFKAASALSSTGHFCCTVGKGWGAEKHWKGGRYTPPLHGAQPTPSHCPPDAKCQAQ